MIKTRPSGETIPDSLRQQRWDALVKREEWIADRGRIEDIPTRYPSWLSLAADRTDHLWVQRSVAGELVAHADHATGRIRMVADACVGAFFAEGKDKAREIERGKRMGVIER